MDHRKLQNSFFVKKDTDGIVTNDNTSILLRAHINEEEIEIIMLSNKYLLRNQMNFCCRKIDRISNIFKYIDLSYIPVFISFLHTNIVEYFSAVFPILSSTTVERRESLFYDQKCQSIFRSNIRQNVAKK